jgi:hypothetical protein
MLLKARFMFFNNQKLSEATLSKPSIFREFLNKSKLVIEKSA